MVDFNPDGSIKLPAKRAQKQADRERKLNSEQAIAIRQDMVYSRSPKKCVLTLELSKAVHDANLIQNIYKRGTAKSQTPMKLILGDSREAKIEIGTDFRRCSDCRSVIVAFRERFDGNILVDKGTCPAKDRPGEGSNFVYEDYFE